MNIQDIKNTISEFFEKATGKTQNIEFDHTDNSLWCSISSPELGVLVGRDGEILSAINHLAKRIVEQNHLEDNEVISVIVDINGFHKKRVENIKAVAHMMAERARYFKSNIEIDPMSSFDRRIIHEFLSAENDLKTESIGQGPTRRVVIKYIPQTI